MSDKPIYSSAAAGRNAEMPDGVCPQCKSNRLREINYPTMDVNPPIYSAGYKCLDCEQTVSWSWQNMSEQI